MVLTTVILAAGASSRMRGDDKLLEVVEGQPLLRRIATAALTCGGPVRVVLPPDRPDRHGALAGLDLHLIIANDAARGMSASIRAGITGLDGPVMILPADMPELAAGALTEMQAAHRAAPDAILRGASGDTPGHPVIFPVDLLPDLARLTGDEGARAVIAAHRGRLRLVQLPGRAALTDLDTPEDWARWRQGR
ncbi:nucleotidyltransferase family protein [Gemmobacter lutimaris]|uniref:Nucleotidyltransferase family protein n=1 Tax=Gemmobacter lutimaris TaxID=2306023 RepID=A0A398BRS2_9RHOB|nr:nucleotidyltransferase family protein [Gemmobacter lutimaris]RID93479.1 nucleotidyltransferase family protein [Gemmobacter lutimaris]